MTDYRTGTYIIIIAVCIAIPVATWVYAQVCKWDRENSYYDLKVRGKRK